MLALDGNYKLKVDLGGVNLSTDPENMKEFTMIQDVEKFLPELRVQLMDPQGVLSHIVPFDKSSNRMAVQVGKSIENVDAFYNDYDFAIYRRKPEGIFGPGTTYDVRGLLDMEALLAPQHIRSWNEPVRGVLEQIAIDELGCDETLISPSLDYTVPLLQPNWTNAQFLTDLKRTLIGLNGEGPFKIFVKRIKGKSIFVCRTLEELYGEKEYARFIVNDEPVEDLIPIVSYSVIDNYKLFGVFGSKKQEWGYFDYFNSTYVDNELQATDMMSLSDFFLIDGEDSENSNSINRTGRNTEFTGDFKNAAQYSYYNRLNGLVKMWVMTWGLENISPGDIVKVLFGQGHASGDLYSYQFSGYWMVERIVHMYGQTHRMNVLLTRNGIDTDKSTSLLVAPNRKKE